MTRPYGPDPYPRGSALSRSFVPLALITLGVVFLLSNLVPDRGRGGLILLGLGAAFAIGRLTTGRYGYAVPAGMLSAIGLYIVLQDVQAPRAVSASGLFFVLLGLGFALIYALGLRPAAIWPLFPAAVLVGLGLVLLGVSSPGPLAAFSWIVAYWPAALVLLGVWLLFRESVPAPLRRPIATLGGLALLAYGVLAAGASLATGGGLGRPSIAPGLGSSPFAETVSLERPISAGQTLTVNNSSGSTTIRGSSDAMVHVVATRPGVLGGSAPEVSLSPTDNGVTLAAAARSRGGVDYTVEVPSGVAVNAQSSSGEVSLEGVVTSGGHITTSSGPVTIRLLPGSAVELDVHTSSGSVEPQGGLQLTNGVTNHTTLTGAIGTPAPGAVLTVQTSSGNVVVSQ